jgi:DNA processing protein
MDSVASPVARDYLRLSLAEDVGPVSCTRLVEYFGGITSVFSASEAELCRVEGIGQARARAIRRTRGDDDRLERELATASEHGVRILCREDAEYPVGLKHIPDPPICLYVRGNLQPDDALAVAIVGSRRCTQYGLEQAKRFAYGLGNIGVTVVSGMARGIDSFAHLGAIEAKGRTLAVLGNGLSSIYPPENRELHDRIVRQGAVLSELPMATSPDAQNFPARNRIIVGLALGVIVVEAAGRSGALITARLATEYNREVFAVPGRVDSPTSQGPNRLIRDAAAKLIMCVQDVLDELGIFGQQIEADSQQLLLDAARPAPTLKLTAQEEKVLAAVDLEGVDPDEISHRCNLSPADTASTLVMLQLKSLVKQLPGKLFVRTTRREPA